MANIDITRTLLSFVFARPLFSASKRTDEPAERSKRTTISAKTQPFALRKFLVKRLVIVQGLRIVLGLRHFGFKKKGENKRLGLDETESFYHNLNWGLQFTRFVWFKNSSYGHYLFENSASRRGVESTTNMLHKYFVIVVTIELFPSTNHAIDTILQTIQLFQQFLFVYLDTKFVEDNNHYLNLYHNHNE